MQIFLPTGQAIEALPDESLLTSLRRSKVYLVSSCGGKGTCGKCRVRVTQGSVNVLSSNKVSERLKAEGYSLACQTVPLGDVHIEIPQESRLTIGDKIAVGRAEDLAELVRTLNVTVSPLAKRLTLSVPPPTLDDSISDLERIKRTVTSCCLEAGNMHVRYHVLKEMSGALRRQNWKVTVTLGTGEVPELLSVRAGTHDGEGYGVAVDIGTTTVVVYLVDMATGRLVDVGSTYNSQMQFGDDVINRIVHATEHGRLSQLMKLVHSDVNDLLEPLLDRHDITPDDVDSMVIAGNTTMTQLFYGLDPQYIREEPYIPSANRYPEIHAGQLGLRVNSGAPVYTVPCVASYVGGDIVAGVLASGMGRRESFSLFLDIGTNGEIALGNSEMLMTAACSAGPCFEGSGIRHGMRATEGAIEAVEFAPETFEPVLKVVGNVKPIGICGSGMIDAIGDMFLKGIIDQRGKLQAVSPRIRDGEEGKEIVLYDSDDQTIVLTEPDIENVVRAKAAIHAGCAVLLREMGFTMDMVDKVFIAGGFGNYLNVEKAILLGMLPDVDRGKFVFLGNTSVAGSYLCLLSADMRREAEEIAARMTYLELSVSNSFMDEYMSALFLPHTDISRYPSVQKRMPGNG